ncbi:hypothetical protein LLS1_27570 [Leifsonia sp. LS1]|nr:hypothetical protein LLS1_27570 [Leifsonia sp. LS1]
MRGADGEVERVHAIGVLVEQEAEVCRGRTRVGDGDEHGSPRIDLIRSLAVDRIGAGVAGGGGRRRTWQETGSASGGECGAPVLRFADPDTPTSK